MTECESKAANEKLNIQKANLNEINEEKSKLEKKRYEAQQSTIKECKSKY
jgi:hypothetical protein